MEARSWVVLKFGGTSVSSKERWETILDVCKKHKQHGFTPFLVCSALSGISNELEKLKELSLKGDFGGTLESIKARHLRFAKELDIEKAEDLLKDDFEELENLSLGLSLLHVSTPSVEARILSFGEKMLTKLAHQWLVQKGVSAALLESGKFLKSSSRPEQNECQSYLSAICDGAYDESLCRLLSSSAEEIFLTQGFVGSNEKGETVLLGRGGSDLSATLIASKIKAAKIEIWSDVPGLFTSNPRHIPTARLLGHLDYEEAQEISFCGAKVLHPKCLEPLKKSSIPLELKWTERPEYEGTLINHSVENSPLKVKAVIAKKGVYIISMDSVEMWQASGFLSDVFHSFKKYGLSVDLVATSQSNVTVTLDVLANTLNEDILAKLLICLSKFCSPKKIGPCAMISLVGKKIKSFFPELGSILKTFKEKKCFLMTQASSDLNFSFLVTEEDADKIVEELHTICFGGISKDSLLGDSWQDLYHKPEEDFPKNFYSSYWWYKKSRDLSFLMKEKDCLYVYDKETVKQRFSSLKKLRAVSRINYAIKANHNDEILSLLYEEGSSFDCVSMDEVLCLKKLFPEITPPRIVFTPNFAPLREYKEALEFGCIVTLDNLYLLEKHGSVFAGKEIFLRFDPGSGRGHHQYVQTAGKKSKFGISLASLGDVHKLVKKYDIRVVGLHAHTGSGILDPENWKETAVLLAKLAKEFEEIRFINLGGGFGVPDNSFQKPLDIKKLDDLLYQVSLDYPFFQFWIEPGRFLVAEAGVLLLKVTQLKKKEDKNFVGVASGMNSLIRPSLYGAYHEIVNLDWLESSEFLRVDVVGPICESGDVLGYDRSLAKETSEGDILLVSNAGAYGRVMASYYNQREPAQEFVL